MATASAARGAPQLPGTHDRLFYGGMAIAMGLTVFAGFAPTFYLRFFTGGPKATLSGGRSPRSSTCTARSSRPGCCSLSSRRLSSRVAA